MSFYERSRLFDCLFNLTHILITPGDRVYIIHSLLLLSISFVIVLAFPLYAQLSSSWHFVLTRWRSVRGPSKVDSLPAESLGRIAFHFLYKAPMRRTFLTPFKRA